MKKLSITQARALIKRELGISAAALEKPPSMNGNPQYPWYSMESGKLSVEVYTNEYLDGRMIALHLGFNDGLGGVSRYFYADTLEEALEYMEVRRWEDIHELVEGKSEEKITGTVDQGMALFSQNRPAGTVKSSNINKYIKLNNIIILLFTIQLYYDIFNLNSHREGV